MKTNLPVKITQLFCQVWEIVENFHCKRKIFSRTHNAHNQRKMNSTDIQFEFCKFHFTTPLIDRSPFTLIKNILFFHGFLT